MSEPRADPGSDEATGRADRLYQQTLRRAQEDPNILGMYLGGSRGKGAVTVHSDYDCDLVVKDEVAAEYRRRLGGDDAGFNLAVSGLEAFRAYAAFGSDREWDRYNFTHLRALVDKLDGEIQRLIDDKGSLPAPIARDRLPLTLDAYMNAVYRALKNGRDGRVLAARLDALESIPFLLTLVFMCHGRLRPYNKYLEWELTHWPLEQLPWSSSEFLALLGPEPAALRTVFRGVRPLATRHGLDQVLDQWGAEVVDFLERAP